MSINENCDINNSQSNGNVSCNICGAMCDLVPFAQFKKCEKQLTLLKLTLLHECFKLCKWYLIAQRTTMWKKIHH